MIGAHFRILGLAGLVVGLLMAGGCATTGSYGAGGRDLKAAQDAYAAGRWSEARKRAEAVAAGARKTERVRDGHILAGQAALAAGDPTGARIHFQQAARHPQTPQTAASIAKGTGDCYFRQRDFRGARNQYELALTHSLTPAQREETCYSLAVSCQALGDVTASAAYARAAGRYRPAVGDRLTLEQVPAPSSPRPSAPIREVRVRPAAPPPVAVQPPAAPVALRVHSRAEWGAKPCRSSAVPMGRPTRITVHHTGEVNRAQTTQEVIRTLRGIQEYHQKTKRWADIAYHYVVDRTGEVWEGRAMNVMGGHAGSPQANAANIGIVLLGNFDRQELPSRQAAALDALLDALMQRYSIAATAVYTHDEIRRLHKVGGTECPGRALAAHVRQVRSALAQGRSRPGVGSRTYTVRKGDTLYSISRRFATTVASLQSANPQVTASQLLPGSRLVLP